MWLCALWQLLCKIHSQFLKYYFCSFFCFDTRRAHEKCFYCWRLFFGIKSRFPICGSFVCRLFSLSCLAFHIPFFYFRVSAFYISLLLVYVNSLRRKWENDMYRHIRDKNYLFSCPTPPKSLSAEYFLSSIFHWKWLTQKLNPNPVMTHAHLEKKCVSDCMLRLTFKNLTLLVFTIVSW